MKEEQGNKFTRSVMVVDDDKDIVELIGMAIGEEFDDIPVHKVYNGNVALEVFEREMPCIIILDLMLPGQSGFLVIDAISKNHKLGENNLPQIIVITAILGQRHKVYAMARGVKEYIFKPFKMETLMAKIRDSLKRVNLE